jgi:hypothetical protein
MIANLKVSYMKTFDMSWICLREKTPEQESKTRVRSAQIPLPRNFPQHNPMRLKHINLRTESQQYHTHASTDSMSSPIPYPAHLAACPSRKRVSVTLPTKPAFRPIRCSAPRAGSQFPRPLTDLPPAGVRSRVPTDTCKANAS